MSRPSKLTKAIELMITAVDLLNQHLNEIEADTKELETLRKLKPHLVIISKAITLSELPVDATANTDNIIPPVTPSQAIKRVRRIKKTLSEPTPEASPET
jgi:hypothetical protein